MNTSDIFSLEELENYGFTGTEEVSKEQLLMAVILERISIALAYLLNSNIHDNADINTAINIIHPIIRVRCDSDEAFEELMDLAMEKINQRDDVIN